MGQHDTKVQTMEGYLLCKEYNFLWPEMWKKQLEVENGTVQHKD
jgi:hypothetical protein